MKNTNSFMKVLLILPVLLFILLLGWIGTNEWKKVDWEQPASVKEELTETGTLASASAQDLNLSETEESAAEQGQTLTPETEESAAAVTEGSEESNPPPEEAQQSVRLLFAGDILLSNHVTGAYDKAGGIQGILGEGFRSEISQADIFMANQEFPFSDRGTAAADKQFTFRLPPARVSMMQEIGVDIVSLANNHSLDYGTDALVDTCQTLDQAGIMYTGAGPNMDRAKELQTIAVNGKTIGFLAASRVYPDTSWVANSKKPGMVSGYDEPTVLLNAIEEARASCDYLVVYVHWGIEKDEKPQSYQTRLGQRIIDAGADLVIGSHPHVLQGVEYYKGKPICYSLGNFLFGSSIPRTALLRADIDFSQGVTALSLVPGTSKAGFTTELTKPEKIQEFYQYFQNLSFDVTVDNNGFIHDNNTYTK